MVDALVHGTGFVQVWCMVDALVHGTGFVQFWCMVDALVHGIGFVQFWCMVDALVHGTSFLLVGAWLMHLIMVQVDYRLIGTGLQQYISQ
jgi:hypothetical protein